MPVFKTPRSLDYLYGRAAGKKFATNNPALEQFTVVSPEQNQDWANGFFAGFNEVRKEQKLATTKPSS